ncbi:hypothetical protein AnigIFM63604_010013 [Aspergillus niger]|uniref:Uncharacterized protein n=1 Tax=Aspergillus niger TaxID=5061 RepID=A0A9W6EE34_ASPNG|nr:hypothetical protein AnigIFM63604_010013 [Aspergillus niger]
MVTALGDKGDIVQASAGPDLGNPYSGGSLLYHALSLDEGQGVQCGMETPEQGVEATEDSLSLVLACLGSHLDRPRRSMMSADIITDCPSSLVPPVAHGTVSDHSSPMV